MKDKDSKILSEAYEQIDEDRYPSDEEILAWKRAKNSKKGTELEEEFRDLVEEFFKQINKTEGHSSQYWARNPDIRHLAGNFYRAVNEYASGQRFRAIG